MTIWIVTQPWNQVNAFQACSWKVRHQFLPRELVFSGPDQILETIGGLAQRGCLDKKKQRIRCAVDN